MTDAEGRILHANGAAGALFLLPPRDMPGRAVESLLGEAYRAGHAQCRRERLAAMTSGPDGGAPMEALRQDGTESPVEVRLTPLRLPRGVVVVEAFRDVSPRRRAEEAGRASAIARPLARRIVHGLVETGGVAQSALQQVGRRLASETPARKLEEFTRAFAEMGLGKLDVERDEGERCAFTGADLLEKRPGSRVATCAFTLGYLSEAVSATRGGRPTLGAEIECQSRGAAHCRFIVQVKRQEEGLARRVRELI